MYEEPTPRVLLPSWLAGPLVVMFFFVAQWSRQFTYPIEFPPEAVLFLPFALMVATVVGVGPALVANAIGTVVMIKICNWFPLFRFPLVWAVVGGFSAWGVVRLFEFGADWTFAFTAAGTVCALACRMRLA